MKAILVILICLTSSYAKDEPPKKGFYLKQIDYRERGSASLSIPGLARIRFRPSYEFRYKVKKKVIYVDDKIGLKED